MKFLVFSLLFCNSQNNYDLGQELSVDGKTKTTVLKVDEEKDFHMTSRYDPINYSLITKENIYLCK